MKLFYTVVLTFVLLNVTSKAQSWSQIHDELNNETIHSLLIQDGVIIAGNYNGYIYTSTDNGTSWDKQRITTASVRVNKLLKYQNAFLAATYGDGVLLSSTGGSTWQSVNTGLTDTRLYTIFADGAALYAGSESNGAYVFNTTSLSWSKTSLGNMSVYSLTKSGNSVLAGTWSGIYSSGNNGTSWESIPSLSAGYVYSIASNATSVFASLGNELFRSTDNGNTWSKCTGIVGNSHIPTVLTYNNYVLVARMGEGVFVSSDNGDSWTVKNEGITDLNIKLLSIDKGTIVAGLENGTIWKADFNSLISSVNDNIKNFVPNGIYAYPNPSNHNITFALEEFINENIKYSIFNSNGELVESRAVTMHHGSLSLDTQCFNDGIYSILVEINNKKIKATFSIIK